MLEPTVPPLPAPPPPVAPERLGWLALVGSLVLFFFVGFPLQAVSAGAGIWFSEIFLFFGWGWALTRWSGRDPVAYLGLGWPGGWPLVFALAVAVANYFAVVIPLQFVVQLVAPRSWIELFDQTQVFERTTGPELVLAVTGAVAAAPIGEELVFRGLLLQGMLRRGVPTLLAVLASAVIFALCHVNPVGFPALVELGVVFGLLFARSRSLWPGMVAHLGSNLTATLLYAANRGQDPAGPATSAELPAVATASALGWLVLGGVLLAARRVPGAWGAPRPRDESRPPVPLGRALLPWAIGASVSLLAWGALDRKGIELDVADLQVRVPSERSSDPAWARGRRAEVRALREEVRVGRASLRQYLEARRALADALGTPASTGPGADGGRR